MLADCVLQLDSDRRKTGLNANDYLFQLTYPDRMQTSSSASTSSTILVQTPAATASAIFLSQVQSDRILSRVQTVSPRLIISRLDEVSLSRVDEVHRANVTTASQPTLSITLHTPSTAVSRIFNETMCVACGEQTRHMLCLPCSHLAYCGSCAPSQRFCLICYRTIIKFQIVYTP